MGNRNEPKVSIIIPIYNVEKYLEDCLNSVTNQILQDIEIICVNDASTDRSLELLRKYEKEDRRIAVIHNSLNGGQSRARNQGLQYARGEFVYFLDSDDMITPEALLELYNTAKAETLDVVCFEAAVFFETERLKKQFHAYSGVSNKGYSGVYKGSDLFVLWAQHRDWVASVCRKFWRRDYLMSHKLFFYENIIHEDELFSFLAIIGANRILCLQKQYFIRRLRESSTMTATVSTKNFIGLFVCYYEILTFWDNTFFEEKVNQSIAEHITVLKKNLLQKYQYVKETFTVQDIDGVARDNHRMKLLIQLFIADNSKRTLLGSFDVNKLEELKEYQKVIVYGAGPAAKEALEHLGRYEIVLYGFAVSDTKVNPSSVMGHLVYDIRDLTLYKQEAIIVVAASQKHHQAIRETLSELGFNNTLYLP